MRFKSIVVLHATSMTVIHIPYVSIWKLTMKDNHNNYKLIRIYEFGHLIIRQYMEIHHKRHNHNNYILIRIYEFGHLIMVVMKGNISHDLYVNRNHQGTFIYIMDLIIQVTLMYQG